MGSMGLTFDVFSNFQNIINGKLSSTKTTRHGINPATGEPNPEVPVSTPEDVDAAVTAAKDAFMGWSKTLYGERRKAVLAFADALEKLSPDFAKLLTEDQGKPVYDKKFIPYAWHNSADVRSRIFSPPLKLQTELSGSAVWPNSS